MSCFAYIIILELPSRAKLMPVKILIFFSSDLQDGLSKNFNKCIKEMGGVKNTTKIACR